MKEWFIRYDLAFISSVAPILNMFPKMLLPIMVWLVCIPVIERHSSYAISLHECRLKVFIANMAEYFYF